MLMRPPKCEAKARYHEVEAKAKKKLGGRGQRYHINYKLVKITNLNSTHEILQ